jgi:hypothetical protein
LITQNHETLHFLKTGGGLVFFEKVANGFFLFFWPGEKRLLENIKFLIINNHETFCFLNLTDGLSAIHVLIREGAGGAAGFRKRDLSSLTTIRLCAIRHLENVIFHRKFFLASGKAVLWWSCCQTATRSEPNLLNKSELAKIQ